MKRILIFVASGFSTRMGGFPKALSTIKGKSVIENAIVLAKSYYDDIYIINNPKTRPAFAKEIEDKQLPAKVREIITGKGDAESVLKSLQLVENEIGETFDATFCWGDAYFVSNIPFSIITNYEQDITQIPSIIVGCSIDQDPYAYFDIITQNGDFSHPYIIKSYFKKKDGSVSVGIHDQCVFRCFSKTFLDCLAEYRKELGYNGVDYNLSPTNEMGLLHSFTFFSKINKHAKVTFIPQKNVFSFNTVEELEQIIDSQND